MSDQKPKIIITPQTIKKKLIVSFSGCFCRFDDQEQKKILLQKITDFSSGTLVIQTNNLTTWDSSLVIILTALIRTARQNKLKTDLSDLPDNLKNLLSLVFAGSEHTPSEALQKQDLLTRWGTWGITLFYTINKGVTFLKEILISFIRLITGRAVFRSVDLWNALEDGGPKAVGIVALISFMVGLILAFVGAIQLQSFGAQIYVASLVTIGMTRIMGAIMCGIIMAGRTGASYAATIGTMQVNEELDALKTMGIPIQDFLTVPRLTALMITTPLLTMLSDFAGMLGGGLVGITLLDIAPQEYIKYSVDAFNITNFLVGIFHGFVFGIVIALCGCYYGINAGRNADSVGVATTNAVVAAIVWMIVLTGFITVLFKVIGI